MLKISARGPVIDELWSLARDGRWHSKRSLAKESSFRPEIVRSALSFLVKYGFAQLSGDGNGKIRISNGPSPAEVASLLRPLTFRDPGDSYAGAWKSWT
jgi:hypothetical protein